MRPLMIQGTSSGAGKTTLVTALCRIFADRGYSVAPYKAQNMSGLAYAGDGFEISQAQAVQAVAARCDIVPDLNPILLKPLGNYHSMVFVHGKRRSRMHAQEYYSGFALSEGLSAARSSLRRLRNRHDLVILEGAGSPAEINMARYDIANMRAAASAGAAVIIISDIERGGAFASLAGTHLLLPARHRKMIRGFVFNRFRGDTRLLEPGFSRLRRITGIPTLGVIPMLSVNMPAEDSLDAEHGSFDWGRRGIDRLDSEIGALARAVSDCLDVDKVEAMLR